MHLGGMGLLRILAHEMFNDSISKVNVEELVETLGSGVHEQR